MAAATRTFVVFKDEPEVVATPPAENSNNSSATFVVAPPPGPLLVFAPDKENIDPFTGSRASADDMGKKRKPALAVKAQPTSPTKRLKPLAEKETKKPLATKSTSKKPLSSKSRATDKKVKRVPSKRSASSATRVHREPSLPRVAEERELVDQATIDSKCRDLTVLPLADISEAHDIPSPKSEGCNEEGASGAEAKMQASEFKAVEGRDTSPASQPEEVPSSVVSPTTSAFSTPERKKIYSAFTFTSPSPASKRFATSRGSSVDRFSDAAF
ncbi:hypothetical protein PYCCODRAFT_1445722 [Trametes coccinea BRFM310]|uniref:Uncharacterized protein n=1 Tax=Trametes coccinea (strain BRFM310) TaxID=1353009 RepID=A0A1Y2IJZ4_TRAC3|nr:hypothetical protein PYCCODRAFT_1445722 [Trametes coccinea BRFM310]